MEIGQIVPVEWPWLLSRTVQTAWEQVPVALQRQSSAPAVAQITEATLRQCLQQPGAAVLVARQNGDPAGYLVALVVPDEITQIPTGLYWDIWVEPAWRGKGVSTALTRVGEAYLRSLGVRLVRRWIAAHNAASLRHAQGDGCEVERLSLVKWL